MAKRQVGVIGATGMVGQRFLTLLENHPYFEVTALCASARSAGKTYREAVGDRWKMKTPMPERFAGMTVLDAADIDTVKKYCSVVFCAVDMKKEDIRALEEAYAKAEIPVVSNNSANRWTPDVPMVIPEINPGHLSVIPAQRRRLGTRRGFIAVKPNCSIQSYVPLLTPLLAFGHFGRGKNVPGVAGDDRQCHPLYRRRRRKKRKRAAACVGQGGKRRD